MTCKCIVCLCLHPTSFFFFRSFFAESVEFSCQSGNNFNHLHRVGGVSRLTPARVPLGAAGWWARSATSDWIRLGCCCTSISAWGHCLDRDLFHPSIHRHSLLLFFFFPSPSRRPLLGRNDGTSPTTATVSTSPSCPPRSPRGESIGHHQSSSKSLPGRTFSAPLRTVTTTTIGSSRRSASSPSSGLLRHRIAQLSNNSRRHDERQ